LREAMSGKPPIQPRCLLCKTPLQDWTCPKCQWEMPQRLQLLWKSLHEDPPAVRMEQIVEPPILQHHVEVPEILRRPVEMPRMVVSSLFQSRQETREAHWNCAVCRGKVTYTVTVGGLHDFTAVKIAPYPVHHLGLMGHNAAAEAAEKKRDAATDGRDRVMWDIVHQIYTTGKFAAGGIAGFWGKFTKALCGTCRETLKKMEKTRRDARALLDEAAKLDPENQVVRKNREALG